MTEILLEPLICRKYPRNIQNTLNLYFGNFRCFRSILVILHVQGYFGHNLGFSGFYRSFFYKDFGVILVIFFRFWGISIIFRFQGILVNIFRFWGYFSYFFGFGGISVIFQVKGVFWSFFWFREYFGKFFRFRVYFGNFQVLGYLVIFQKFRFYVVYLNFRWVLVSISGFIH